MPNYCQGCTDDFYNGNNSLGVKECWSKKSAKVVTRYRIAWWAASYKKNCTKVKTYDCHKEPGKFAFYKPEHFMELG
jgi:hypothetical protein